MDTASAQEYGMLDVSVIIVSWNTRQLLHDCLDSVYRETSGLRFEVILVDNASVDDSLAMVRLEFPQVRILENQSNLGFVTASNRALDVARGRYALLLNSDTLVLENAIAKVLRFADLHPDGAVFGCRVLNPDRSLQRTCFMYPSPLNMLIQSTYFYKAFPRSRFFGREFMTWWDYGDVREVETISGCFSMVRKEAIDEVGKMDPVYFFYGDDPDWCFRFKKAGWKIIFTPSAQIVHFGGQSTLVMRRTFRLQLAGSQLIFNRLHRSALAFLMARILTALFFLLRIPYWLAKSVIDGKERKLCLETAGTCSIGAVYCLFRWKRLVMNREELERRLKKATRGNSMNPKRIQSEGI